MNQSPLEDWTIINGMDAPASPSDRIAALERALAEATASNERLAAQLESELAASIAAEEKTRRAEARLWLAVAACEAAEARARSAVAAADVQGEAAVFLKGLLKQARREAVYIASALDNSIEEKRSVGKASAPREPLVVIAEKNVRFDCPAACETDTHLVNIVFGTIDESNTPAGNDDFDFAEDDSFFETNKSFAARKVHHFYRTKRRRDQERLSKANKAKARGSAAGAPKKCRSQAHREPAGFAHGRSRGKLHSLALGLACGE